MALTVLALLLFLAPPFWEAAAPADWSDSQIAWLLAESPWAYREGGAQIYLASARPLWEAERERRRRKMRRDEEIGEEAVEEYFDFLAENRDRYIVLAVRIPLPQYLLTPKATKRMEERCVMVADGREYKIVGHFPPTAGDRYLRLVFPRVAPPDSGVLEFRLYVPGVPMPFRWVRFETEKLTYQGHPEF